MTTTTRMEKALDILKASLVQPIPGNPHLYLVTSSNGQTAYQTSVTACNCPDNAYRGVTCKHILACQMQADYREDLEARVKELY